MRALVCTLVLALAVTAHAEEKKQDSAGKRTLVKFDGDNIDGTLQRPEGDLLSGREAPDMPPLSHAPTSFSRASRRNLIEAADAVKGR